jgi:histidine triad (HIT) family protein
MNCLFCRIISGQLPSTIVFENDRIVAFKDVVPAAPMHVLIVPREHIATLNALESQHDSLVGEMVRTAAALAAAAGYADNGFRTVFNCNADAGQTVFHVHLHLLAGRRLSSPG